MDRFECNAPRYLGNLKELAENVDADNADTFFETPNQSMHSIFDETLTTTPKEDVFYTPRRQTPYRKPVDDSDLSSNSESSLNSSDAANNNDELDTTLTNDVNDKNTVGINEPIEERKASMNISIAPDLADLFKEPKSEEKTSDPSTIPETVLTTETDNENLNLPGPSVVQKDATEVKKSAKKLMFRDIEPNKTPEKTHTMVSRLDLRKNTPRYKSSTNNSSNKVLKRKLHSPSKMTLAEQILHFQKDTPPRFKARDDQGKPLHKEIKRLKLTVAQSPILATKLRATKQQNSGSTEPIKGSKEVKVAASRKTLQPSFMNYSTRSTASRNANEDTGFIVPKAHVGVKSCSNSNRRTYTKPFSFEEREKARKEEKENKLQKQKQEEAPVFKFKATPLPAYLKKKGNQPQKKS